MADLNRKMKEDVDTMFMLCVTLPKAMQRVKELDEIIAECEEEEREAWKWYNSKFFHFRGQEDKAKLDSVVRVCRNTIINSKHEKKKILKQIEADTGKTPKSADDVREMLFSIVIVLAELIGIWAVDDVLIDELEQNIFGGADLFVREKSMNNKNEERVDLYEQIKNAQTDWEKQKAEKKESDKSDKDWDR